MSFDSHNDIRSVVSERVGDALKLILIREARQTLDIVNYDERCDVAFSRPILTALRDAANRGVKIRFMVAWLGQKLYDTCGKDSTDRYLLDVPTKEPIQYMIFGGSRHKSPNGWSWFDAIHEKLLIVDGKLVVAGGRSWAESYFDYIDTDFLIRGPLVPQLMERYDTIWKTVLTQTQPLVGNPKNAREKVDRYDHFGWQLMDDEPQQLRDLITFIESPYDVKEPTGRARVLHNEFLAQLIALGDRRAQDLDIDKRLATLQDDIVNNVASKLTTAKEARLIMLFGIAHPKLLKAIVDARRRGVDLTVFLNREVPQERDLPITPTWIISLQDVVAMLEANVNVWAFHEAGPLVQGINMPKGTIEYHYLHRKLAIVDDTIFIGSHNLDAPSSFGNDELDIEIEDPALARQWANDLFDDTVLDYGQLLDAPAVERQYGRDKVLRGMIPDPVYRTM